MNSNNPKLSSKKKGAILAGLTAALLANSPYCASDDTATTIIEAETIKCLGVNACKGQSHCKMTLGNKCPNDCKGANACKGQGWIKATARECEKMGGRPLEE